MEKIYQTLVEEFGYIAEAPINATGYDPDQVQYAYKDGKANPNWPGNKPAAGDPSTMKPGETRYNPDYDPTTGKLKSDTDDNPADQKTDTNKPKPGRVMNPGARAFQHFLNSQGYKVKVDGKMGPETKGAGDAHYTKLAAEIKAASDAYIKTMNDADKAKRDQLGKTMDQHIALQGLSYADVVGNRPGNAYIGSPEFIKVMKQYGYDPKTGDPIGGSKPGVAAPGQAGRYKTGALPSKQEDIILNSVQKLEAIFKKYGIQAECAYKEDGSLLTEDDWVLKNINMFSLQEQMEIWRILSELKDISGDAAYSKMQQDMDARAAKERVKSAYKASQQAGMNYNAAATNAAQNMPQQQSTLGKFGKNLAGRFGLGGGKKAAIKGAAKLGLRAIPFLGTAYMLYDIGSALYDTFATTEIADLDPADQQIIATEIKNLTQMSKSADYDSVSEDTKKRVTAILNAANKMAQKAEA